MWFYNKLSKTNLIYEGSSCIICNHANGLLSLRGIIQNATAVYGPKRPKMKIKILKIF